MRGDAKLDQNLVQVTKGSTQVLSNNEKVNLRVSENKLERKRWLHLTQKLEKKGWLSPFVFPARGKWTVCF